MPLDGRNLKTAFRRLGHLACAGVLALSLGMAPTVGWAAEPKVNVLATPVFILQEVADLLKDLQQPGENVPVVLDRAQELMGKHGDRLIRLDQGFVPITDYIAMTLRKQGLMERFAEIYDTAAANLLQQALQESDEALMLQAVQRYPGTPAAAEAARTLADRAWDTGRIGLYLTLARDAGEFEDPRRAKRYEAALDLLAQGPVQSIPEGFSDFDHMWEETGLASGSIDTDELGDTGVRLAVGDDLVAMFNGENLTVIDPLVGRVIGGAHTIGSGNAVWQPAVRGNTFIALSVSQDGVFILTSVDGEGNLTWQIPVQAIGAGAALSSPVIVDDIIAIAAVEDNDDGSELHVMAFDLKTGVPRWHQLVAKNTTDIAGRWRRSDSLLLPPDLCAHRGRLVALSNRGVVGSVSTEGRVRNLWTYETRTIAWRMDGGNDRAGGRRGRIMSDGHHLAIAPGDSGVVTLVDDQGNFRTFTGDGCDDELVDFRDGKALLLGRRSTLIETSSGEARWSHFLTDAGGPAWGLIGAKRILVNRGPLLKVIATDDGKSLPSPSQGLRGWRTLALANGVLLEAERTRLVGWGNATEFIRHLTDVAAKNPEDHRPLVALHSLHGARGDTATAYDYLLQALDRGGPAGLVDRAAALARRPMDLNLGQAGFDTYLSRFLKLQPHAPQIDGESQWWQGRHYELSGKTREAITAYQRGLASPRATLVLPGNFKQDLHLLCNAGLARLGAISDNPWAESTSAASDKPADIPEPWSKAMPRMGPVMVDGQTVVEFAAGDVQARDLQTGEVLWRRKPEVTDPSQLGVAFIGETVDQIDGGPRINVLPGTSAAAAGLLDDDVITGFNGNRIASFLDLRNAVSRVRVGQPFTVTVKRIDDEGNDVTLDLNGNLGRQPLAPLAARGGMALIMSMTFDMVGRRMIPDRTAFQVWALDLNTGEKIWNYGKPLQQGLGDHPPAPVLTRNGLLLVADGNDLVALKPTSDGVVEKWRRQGMAGSLHRQELLESPQVALFNAPANTLHLVDSESGRTLVELPANPDGAFLLKGSTLLVHDLQGYLVQWDLGTGQSNPLGRERGLRPVAISDDGVFGLDPNLRLQVIDRASGAIRRHYSDWALVEDAAAHGDQLYILVRHRGRPGTTLAAIGLGSGTPLWERDLPPELEVQGRLRADANGVACVLTALGQQPGYLRLDAEGTVTAAHAFRRGQQIRHRSEGLLQWDEQQMGFLAATLPDTPEPLQAIPNPLGVDPQAISNGDWAQLPWRQLGWEGFQSRYAVLKGSAGELIIAAEIPPGGPDLEFRYGDAGPVLDTGGGLLVLSAGGRRPQLRSGNGWLLDDLIRLKGEDGTWRGLAVLRPPILKRPGSRLLFRAATDQAIDGPAAPWWLRRAWRPVVFEAPKP